MKNTNGKLLCLSNGLKYLLALSILQKNLDYLGIALSILHDDQIFNEEYKWEIALSVKRP